MKNITVPRVNTSQVDKSFKDFKCAYSFINLLNSICVVNMCDYIIDKNSSF